MNPRAVAGLLLIAASFILKDADTTASILPIVPSNSSFRETTANTLPTSTDSPFVDGGATTDGSASDTTSTATATKVVASTPVAYNNPYDLDNDGTCNCGNPNCSRPANYAAKLAAQQYTSYKSNGGSAGAAGASAGAAGSYYSYSAPRRAYASVGAVRANVVRGGTFMTSGPVRRAISWPFRRMAARRAARCASYSAPAPAATNYASVSYYGDNYAIPPRAGYSTYCATCR